MKFVGVTKCPVGVAHTYMAAEKLEKAGKELGYEVKIETQGSVGVENQLSTADIASADFVIISADVAIDGKERFAGKKLLELPIQPVLKDVEAVIMQAQDAPIFTDSQTKEEKNKQVKQAKQPEVITQLMNGVSHMIPFVVVGGLFIALAIAIGGHPTAEGMTITPGSFWDKLNAIGGIGFNLMIPILAGYIAYAISGRAALAPAMIGAEVANNADILGTKAGTGFIGAIIVGYAAGYLVKWMQTWPMPKSLKPVMPIFVIPILGVGIISFLLIFVLGAPISWLTTGLENMLHALSANSSTSIILGLVLGAMVAVDMGGPINKVAFLFGVASIAQNNPEIMGTVACCVAVPPLSVGLATLVKRNNFTEEEQAAGIPAILMGLIGITEGAIPFASADPKRVLPSIIAGSAVSGALGMLLGITDVVPHGGPIVGFLGAVNHLGLFLLAILAGVIVSTILITVTKSAKLRKDEGK